MTNQPTILVTAAAAKLEKRSRTNSSKKATLSMANSQAGQKGGGEVGRARAGAFPGMEKKISRRRFFQINIS